MLVGFDHSAEALERDDEVAEYMRQLGTVLSEGERHVVLGLMFVNSDLLLVIALGGNPNILNIVSSEYFKIFDPYASNHWVVIPHASNKYMWHFHNRFDDFHYVGIDKLVSDPEFFLRYHGDDSDSISYIKRMHQTLWEESGPRASTS